MTATDQASQTQPQTETTSNQAASAQSASTAADAPATQAATTPVTESEDVTTAEYSLGRLQAELQQSRDELLRAMAEIENVRKRAHEESAKARKFAVESFAETLLPVADSLEAASADTSNNLEVLKKGLDLTLSQLRSAFERAKLQAIAPNPGDKFDPLLHQAIATVPSDQPANTVVSMLQKGFQLSERTLRPALVTVAAPK